VLSIVKTTPVKEPYFFAPLLADVSVGAVVSIAIIPLALLLGGFNFFMPWLLVTPPLLFAAGFLRGSSAGNVWVKGLATNAANILLLFWCSNALTVLLGLFVTVLPAVGGISFRRYRLDHGNRIHAQQ